MRKMSSASANDIIGRALVKARVLSPTQSVPSALQSQVYDDLNDMLESWWVGEKLLVMADVIESFTLTAGTGEYTWGSGGDLNSARPNQVKDETFLRSGDSDYNVGLRPMATYRRIRNKSVSGTPEIFSVEYEYPLAKVYFHPKPDSAYTAHFRSSKALISFTDKTTSVDLEPGYRRAIVNNLAVEILSNFGKTIPQSLALIADQSKRAIKSANSHIPEMSTPELEILSGGHFGDINRGPFG